MFYHFVITQGAGQSQIESFLIGTDGRRALFAVHTGRICPVICNFTHGVAEMVTLDEIVHIAALQAAWVGGAITQGVALG